VNRPRITTVILAAGASTRLGRPKQLVPYHGTPLLAHAARTVIAAGLGPVVVVLGSESTTIAPTLKGLDVAIVTNDAWRDGIGRSVAVGVSAAARDPACGAIILMTCDQPGVTADHLRRLAETWRESGAPAVGSAYGGTTGVPALFDRTMFDALTGLTPAEGAKGLLGGAPAVACPVCEVDVDTPEDLPPS
jgi:molybdenum cofactor cytidylyltransferase